MKMSKHMVKNENPLVLSISTVVGERNGKIRRAVHNVHNYPQIGTFYKLIDTSKDNTWSR